MKKSGEEKIVARVKKISLIILLCFFCQNAAQAQTNEANEAIKMSKNGLYFDTGIIPGVSAFINYERLLLTGKSISWYGRAGFGYGGILLIDGGLGGLGAVTMLTGKKDLHFELNAGVFSGKGTDGTAITYPLLDMGLRYQKPNGGFIFKSKVGILGVGIGLGYAF